MLPERAARRRADVLHVGAARVRGLDEAEEPAPCARQASRNGSSESRPRYGLTVSASASGAARGLEVRGRVRARGRADVAALRRRRSRADRPRARTRTRARTRGRPSAPSASKNASCGLTATAYGATASTIPRQKRATSAAAARPVRVAASSTGAVRPRIEPDDELARLRSTASASRSPKSRRLPARHRAGAMPGRQSYVRQRAAQRRGPPRAALDGTREEALPR